MGERKPPPGTLSEGLAVSQSPSLRLLCFVRVGDPLDKSRHYKRAIELLAAAHVNTDDQALFVDVIMDDLKRLHEGVIVRYKI